MSKSPKTNAPKLFTVLERQSMANADTFVAFWKQQYEFPNMHWYADNIGLQALTFRNL